MNASVSVRQRCTTKMEKWHHTTIMMQNTHGIERGLRVENSKSRQDVALHLLNLSPVTSISVLRLFHCIYRKLCSMCLMYSWHLCTSILSFPLILGYAGNSCVLEGLKHSTGWTTEYDMWWDVRGWWPKCNVNIGCCVLNDIYTIVNIS